MAMNGGGNDTQQNCILELCCGGKDSKQVEVLTEVAQHALPFLVGDQAKQVAEWVARNWDLMPKGTTYGFKQIFYKLSRQAPYTD
jgi:hypothetical protein